MVLQEIVSHGQENTKHGDWWQSDREKGLKGIQSKKIEAHS